jgi:hypothetical protein
MASSSALKMAALLVLALFAGQLLMAMPTVAFLYASWIILPFASIFSYFCMHFCTDSYVTTLTDLSVCIMNNKLVIKCHIFPFITSYLALCLCVPPVLLMKEKIVCTSPFVSISCQILRQNDFGNWSNEKGAWKNAMQFLLSYRWIIY